MNKYKFTKKKLLNSLLFKKYYSFAIQIYFYTFDIV